MNQKILGQKTQKTKEKHKNKGELENQHSSKYEISKKHETLRNGNNKRIIKILKKYHR